MSITAGLHHAKYAPGETAAAICLVDSTDVGLAEEVAFKHLAKLGWDRVEVESTKEMPPGGDVSGWGETMAGAYADALELGVCLVVYPRAKH